MIRRVGKSDYNEVRKLVSQVHQIHLNNRCDIYIDGEVLEYDYFNEIINDDDSLNYLYEDNNKVVGVILVDKKTTKSLPIIKSKNIYYINDIVVDEKFRKKGIGRKLYNYIKEKAIDDNIDSIELNVWSFNKAAIKFYESLGMKVKNMKFEDVINK
ncbi:MAG: GNAT family N-acetyltransferase [Bacilli bacterium]|nr:GNAT family N-acetyltransferase [Bacilli bacterium]